MSGVRLVELSLKSFRSFVDETTVTFPEKGLVCISGKSGVGKTNINLAIAFALGFSPLPATALQSWLTDDPLRVRLVLDTPEGRAVITRGKTVALTVGDRRITSAAAVEVKIREFFNGIPVDMLDKLVYRAQKKPGLFLSMDDADKKEFLGSLLGLGKYEEQIEEAAKRVSELERQLATKAATLTVYEAQYKTAQAGLGDEPQAPDLDALRDDIARREEAHLRAAKAHEDALALYGETERKANEELAAEEVRLKAPVLAAQAACAEFKHSKPVFVRDWSTVNEIEAKLHAVKSRIDKVKAEDEAKNKAAALRQREIDAKLSTVSALRSRIGTVSSQLEEKQAKLQGLLESKCVTCGQAWSSELDIDETRQSIDDLKGEAESLDARCASLDALQVERKALSLNARNPVLDKFAEIEQKLAGELATASADLKTELTRFESGLLVEQSKLETAYAKEWAKYSQAIESVKEAVWSNALTLKKRADTLGAQLADASERLNAAKLTYRTAEVQYSSAQKVFAHQKASVKSAQGNYEVAKADTERLSQEANREKDVLAALRSFLNAIFDEILAEVAEETNNILVNLPNVQRCTMEFRTDTVTKKGTAKRAIVPVITVNGHETTLRDGCSGGMATAIELAVDLAVSSVVQARTGAAPQWLVLDESFDGLSADVKEPCLEILKTYAADKLVLCVTHAPEFKEVFGHFIRVESDGDRSSVVTE